MSIIEYDVNACAFLKGCMRCTFHLDAARVDCSLASVHCGLLHAWITELAFDIASMLVAGVNEAGPKPRPVAYRDRRRSMNCSDASSMSEAKSKP
jgi:hypothetical protein